MNLDALAETIETLKKRIEQHRQELSENEMRTRAALINPLLHALGWDVSDPALVKLEYNVGRQRADYALMNHDGKPAAVFEAKKLGESLDDHQIQTLNYANREGVGYAGLTNGDRWELYSVFEQAPLKERRRIYISIVDDPPYECALELLALWRLNLASGKLKKAKTPIIVVHEEEMEEKAEETNPPKNPEPTPAPSPEPPVDGEWVTLSRFMELWMSADREPEPETIRFDDDREASIRNWSDLHVELAKWLHSKGLLTTDQMPLKTSSGSYVANSEPKAHTGKEMQSPVKIADGIYVSRFRHTTQKLRHLRLLIENFSVDTTKVYLKRRNDQ